MPTFASDLQMKSEVKRRCLTSLHLAFLREETARPRMTAVQCQPLEQLRKQRILCARCSYKIEHQEV